MNLLGAKLPLSPSLRRTSALNSLKLEFVNFRERILDSRVEGGMPSLAAAPCAPEIFPLLCASAASMPSAQKKSDRLRATLPVVTRSRTNSYQSRTRSFHR